MDRDSPVVGWASSGMASVRLYLMSDCPLDLALSDVSAIVGESVQ